MRICYRKRNGALVPWQRFAKQFEAEYADGADLWMERAEERSQNQHKATFAAINEAWKNLREDDAQRYLTPDRLRKHALIEAGYFTSVHYPCASRAEAVRWCQMLARRSPDHRIILDGSTIEERIPKSQSYRSMTKREFAASMNAVLDVCAALTGVPVDELMRNADRAA